MDFSEEFEVLHSLTLIAEKNYLKGCKKFDRPLLTTPHYALEEKKSIFRLSGVKYRDGLETYP